MKKIVLSDPSVNCYGFRVLTQGIDLEQYKKNPIVLFMHQRSDENIQPIGKMTDLHIEGDKLVGVPVFDLNDQFAAKIADKFENGFLNMASIGFEVIETSEDISLFLPGQKGATVTRCKLLEVSIVDIGANDNAVVVGDAEDAEDAQTNFVLEVNLAVGSIFRLSNDNLKNNNMTKQLNAHLIATLALSANATDEEIAQRVAELKEKSEKLEKDTADFIAKINEYEAEKKLAKEQETQHLINEAVKDGRLSADKVATFTEIADKAGNNVLKNALDALVKPVKPTDIILANVGAEDIPDWDTEDKKGTLMKIKTSQPEVFAKMFAQKFGNK